MKGERAQRRHVDLRLQVLPLLEHHLLRLLFCIEDLVGLVEQLDAIDVRILEDILVRGPLAHVEDREGLEDRIVEYLLEAFNEVQVERVDHLNPVGLERLAARLTFLKLARAQAVRIISVDEAPDLGCRVRTTLLS